jgi:transposase, IS5 family
LDRAIPRADRSKGGRPAFDPVLMFKILILQASHNLSDERCEYLIKDRLSFMRFLGLGLADAVPDANTIWTFREALTRTGLIDALFQRFDAVLREAGFLAMGGQIIDATIVAAPRQRNTAAEKQEIKAGRVPVAWQRRPAKLRQKDRDARWTVKYTKAKPREDGAQLVDFAIPAFGYKNHLSIDRTHGLIRRWIATDAARYDGAQLPVLTDKTNTAAAVWADTAYRSKKNETWLAANGLRSQIHRKKPAGAPMPGRISRANAVKSRVRSRVEHVFARQKGPMALFVRTIGLARATTKIGLANLVYNMQRMIWLSRKAAVASPA